MKYLLGLTEGRNEPIKDLENAKGLTTNNMNILHLIFGPSLAAAQSQNPQRSAATPAVLR
jgi:hypothetical protein